MAEVRWRAPRPRHVVTNLDRAWIAGLVEGEGSYYLRNSKDYPAVVFQLNMADEDVVRRAHRLSGRIGTVNPHDPGSRGVKQQWRWRISSQAEVAWFMDQMYPLMGERRRAKIDELRGYLPEWAKEAA